MTDRIVAFAKTHPHAARSFAAGSTPCGPESAVINGAGELLVGIGARIGCGTVQRFLPDGTPLDTYAVAIENVGADWVEFANDQCTVYYTSEGGRILRYDACARKQLTDYATPNGTRFGLRLLPPGDGTGGALVTESSRIARIDASGQVVQTYGIPGAQFWFDLALDPDCKSFWSADQGANDLYRFDLDTAAVTLGPIHLTAFGPGSFEGLCIAGEPRAARKPCPPRSARSGSSGPGSRH